MTINGDIYCDDDLAIFGTVNGDVYSSGAVTGWSTGQIHQYVTAPPVPLPGLEYADFISSYYIGSDQYSVQQIPSGIYMDLILTPSASNPAGIYYVDGNLELDGAANISGTLVIRDNLLIDENAVVTITAVKNFPALIMGGDLTMEGAFSSLSISGLAQIDGCVDMKNQGGSSLNVTGALCIFGDGIKNTAGCTVNLTVAHEQAAIEIWHENEGMLQRWVPAADAFYKTIERN